MYPPPHGQVYAVKMINVKKAEKNGVQLAALKREVKNKIKKKAEKNGVQLAALKREVKNKIKNK